MSSFAYAAWAREQLLRLPEDQRQNARSSYFSELGRAQRYDDYRAYCKANGHEWDAPNEKYWELKKRPWHTPVGAAAGITSLLIWVLIGLVGGTTGRRS